MKLQVIFNFYIIDNECNNAAYQIHYVWLSNIASMVDKMTFILTYNSDIEIETINRIKSILVSICNVSDITFITEPNNPEFREGIIYKKYIIDRLDQYDDYLTFFGHTKGVSNPNGFEDQNNLLLWIFSMYYLSFAYIIEMQTKLESNMHDYITYGGAYFNDFRHTNNYHWFYSGSLYWINTKRLNEYIIKNNIDKYDYITVGGERIKNCAELYPGHIFPNKYAAFYMDEVFNKDFEPFNDDGWEISYKHFDKFLQEYLQIDDYLELYNQFRNMLNKITE